MYKLLPVLFCLLTAALVVSAWQNPTHEDWKEKVSPIVLQKAQSGQAVEFILRLKSQADVSAAKQLKGKKAKGNYVYQQLKQTAERSQKGLKDILESENVSYRSFFIVNAIYAKGDYDLIQRLAKREEVASVDFNPQIQMEQIIEEAPTADLRGKTTIEWGITMINADAVWDMGYRGQGVVVAGQDTGVEWFHPAIRSQYRGTTSDTTANHDYNWHDAIREISDLHQDSVKTPDLNDCGLDVAYACDDNNHGTFTVGLMVGEDGEEQIGVAPEASWIACRNMERGYGSPASYMECYEFFLAPTDLQGENPAPDLAPHVVNNSWSCPEMEGCNASNWAMMEALVDNLKAAGIVVVVSAGNSGRSGCSSVSTPSAIFENSFTVGVTASNDSIHAMSSRGPVTVDGSGRIKPNVVAPGIRVRSAVRRGNYQNGSGTSAAGPMVAGTVALMISANPALAGEVEMIEDILESTAVPKTTDEMCGGVDGQMVPNNTYGFGRIDALAAVQMAIQTVNTSQPLAKDYLYVFPNPTTGTFQIETNKVDGPVQFEVYTADGKLVLTKNWQHQIHDQQRIDASHLPIGVYFYRLFSDDQNLSGKIVRQ
ncbi:MAG: S8 family peptidase [Bacteroidota bacterium]